MTFAVDTQNAVKMEPRVKMLTAVRKFLINSLIILGITASIILILEGGLRLFFPQLLQGESIVGETFMVDDVVIGYRYRAGAKWRFSHPEYDVVYTINDFGFRDRKEHLIPKPAGTTRVLLVGDSFTFGIGVNYDESWPVIAESRITNSGRNKIDLVKAGMGGLHTREEFFLIKELVEKYDPDVVVVGFLINDLQQNSLDGVIDNTGDQFDAIVLRTNNQPKETFSEVLRRYLFNRYLLDSFHLYKLVQRLIISIDDNYVNLYLATPDRGSWLRTPLNSRSSKQLEVTKTLFRLIAEYCKAREMQLMVLSIPQQFQVLYSNVAKTSSDVDVAIYDRLLGQFATENHFDWISTLDAFMESGVDPDDLFYRFDGHLTPEGNEIVAKVFVERVLPLIQ